MRQEIVIDETVFGIEFAGFDCSLRARLSTTHDMAANSDGSVYLLPWPCERHLANMARFAEIEQGSVVLDTEGYADELLRWCGVPEPQHLALRPLALWWACGIPPSRGLGEGYSLATDQQGWLELRPGLRVQLRTWTWGEKLKSLSAHTKTMGDEMQLAPAGYLDDMLRASVVAFTSDTDSDVMLSQLDSQATQRLIQAVVSLNEPDRDEFWTHLPPDAIGATLRICSELGWTPSQVHAAPASEIDHLLTLLDLAEGHATSLDHSHRHSRHRRIEDFPDSIVIRFDDEEQPR